MLDFTGLSHATYCRSSKQELDQMHNVTKDRRQSGFNFSVSLLLLGIAFIHSNSAHAGIVTLTETIVLLGIVEQTVETKTATGSITVTPPGGPPITQTMPAAGGSIAIRELFFPFAFARATVDLATQRQSHAWGYRSGAGYTASASTDIHKSKTVTSKTVSNIIQRRTIRRDPNEIIDAFFGTGVSGRIDFAISLMDNTSGMSLFDSTTTLTDSSPDVIHDNTGMLTWTRTPGFFDGDEGNLNGLPNLFSNNRWVLDPFSLVFDTPVTLNPGEMYIENIAGFTSSSAVSSVGAGVIGISDLTIPEPSTLLLSGAALVGFLAHSSRRRKSIGRNDASIICSYIRYKGLAIGRYDLPVHIT